MKKILSLLALTVLSLSWALKASTFDDLMDAISDRNSTRVVQALDTDKSIVNRKDLLGYTPLHRAIASHKPEIVEALFNAGAKLDIIGTEDNVGPFDYIESVEYDVQGEPEKLRELQTIREFLINKL